MIAHSIQPDKLVTVLLLKSEGVRNDDKSNWNSAFFSDAYFVDSAWYINFVYLF